MTNHIWHETAGSFLDALQTKARGGIVAYSLIAGCALWAVERAGTSKFPPLLLTIEEDDRLLGAAYMSPPRKLLLCCAADAAANGAREIHARGWSVPAVHVNAEAAQPFVETWSGLTGHPSHPGISERLLALSAVRTPAHSPGAMRRALPADTELLVAWQTQFQREAMPDEPMTDDAVRTLTTESIHAGTRYLWEDGEPVSMALVMRHVLDGVWFTGVHTPQEKRRQGYATSCVAQLSAKHLAEGASYCFLFTDLANPTSNSIYEKIGYERVCDFQNYNFGA